MCDVYSTLHYSHRGLQVKTCGNLALKRYLLYQLLFRVVREVKRFKRTCEDAGGLSVRALKYCLYGQCLLESVRLYDDVLSPLFMRYYFKHIRLGVYVLRSESTYFELHIRAYIVKSRRHSRISLYRHNGLFTSRRSGGHNRRTRSNISIRSVKSSIHDSRHINIFAILHFIKHSLSSLHRAIYNSHTFDSHCFYRVEKCIRYISHECQSQDSSNILEVYYLHIVNIVAMIAVIIIPNTVFTIHEFVSSSFSILFWCSNTSCLVAKLAVSNAISCKSLSTFVSRRISIFLSSEVKCIRSSFIILF